MLWWWGDARTAAARIFAQCQKIVLQKSLAPKCSAVQGAVNFEGFTHESPHVAATCVSHKASQLPSGTESLTTQRCKNAAGNNASDAASKAVLVILRVSY